MSSSRQRALGSGDVLTAQEAQIALVRLRPADRAAPGPSGTGRAPGRMALHGVAPATEVRTGLVSGIVSTDIYHQE